MGRGEKVDYRISMLVVLCKDCNQDVGLYPARHQCQVERPPLPPLPPLPTQKSDPRPSVSLLRKASSPALSQFTSTRQPPSPPSNEQHHITRANTTTTGPPKWSSSRRSNSKPNSPADDVKDDPMNATSYLDHYSAHLPAAAMSEHSGGGTSLKKKWGSVKQNEKWKQLIDKGEQQKPQQSSAKLWKKLVQATQNMAVQDERGPESDESDFEGESHVSRILREHHEKKQHKQLPSWLLDNRTPLTATPMMNDDTDNELLLKRQASSRRRLWDKTSAADQEPSAREIERQIIRQEHQRNSRRQQQSTTLMNDSDHSDDVDVENDRYQQKPSTTPLQRSSTGYRNSNNTPSSSSPSRFDDDKDTTTLRKNKRLERMQSARRCMEDQYRDPDDRVSRDDIMDYYGESHIQPPPPRNDHRVDDILSLRQARHAALSRSRSDRAIRSAYQDNDSTQAVEITPSNYRSFMKQDNNKPLADLPTLGRQYSTPKKSSKQRYLVPEQRDGLGLF
ncbi:unnamed protein product [Absidia cylindrospora]